MIRACQTFFFRLSSREKVLLVLFVWVLVLIGLVSAFGKVSTANTALRVAQSQLDTQDIYLGMRSELASELARSGERFEPAKTLDAAALQGRVDRIARESEVQLQGFNYRRGQQNDIYDLHELRVNLRGITYDQLFKLDRRIQAEAPYLKLQSLRASADRRQRDKLDCTLILSSFEMKKAQ